MGQVGQRTQHQSGVSSWAILDVEKVVQDYISQQIFVDGDRMWKEFGKPCGAADHSELRPQPIDPAVPDRASIRTRGMALKLRGDANGGNRNAHRRPRRCDRPGRRRLSPSADQDRASCVPRRQKSLGPSAAANGSRCAGRCVALSAQASVQSGRCALPVPGGMVTI
jgi:hypothetical protein